VNLNQGAGPTGGPQDDLLYKIRQNKHSNRKGRTYHLTFEYCCGQLGHWSQKGWNPL